MPRGFLVKRSKRVVPPSYRWPREPRAEDGPPSASLARRPGHDQSVLLGRRPPRSPARPTSGPRRQGPDLASPTPASAFPAAAAAATLAALEHLLDVGSSTDASKPRHKVKRVSERNSDDDDDDHDASPVPGPEIRAAPESRPPGRGRGDGDGDGGFVCQLCKEAYGDPLSLAQHRCSRMVRVEYRCPECDKAFGCPANLASHRRWHKPKAERKGRVEAEAEEAPQSASGGDHRKFKGRAPPGKKAPCATCKGPSGLPPRAHGRHPPREGSFIFLASRF